MRSVEACRPSDPVRIAGGQHEAGQRGDLSSRGDLPDHVVAGIGDVEVAAAIACHSPGIVKARRAARSINAADDSLATCQRRQYSRWGQLLDGVIVCAGDVDVAAAIGGYSPRNVETQRSQRSIVNTPLLRGGLQQRRSNREDNQQERRGTYTTLQGMTHCLPPIFERRNAGRFQWVETAF